MNATVLLPSAEPVVRIAAEAEGAPSTTPGREAERGASRSTLLPVRSPRAAERLLCRAATGSPRRGALDHTERGAKRGASRNDAPAARSVALSSAARPRIDSEGAPSTRPGREAERGASRNKLLQFVSVLAAAGTENQVMSLARGLDPSRFDVSFACLDSWGDLRDDIERSARPLAEYPVERLYGRHAWRQQLRFRRDLEAHRIELVHTYGFYANAFAIPAARIATGGPAIVASIRDMGDHLRPTQRRVQRLVCRVADGILVNSEAVKARLEAEGYDPHRLTVIRNGIDLGRFGARRSDGRLHRELGLPASARLIGVLSRLHRLKGLEHFLDAAAIVAPHFPEARFLVVGEDRVLEDGVAVEGPYKRELQARAALLGLSGRLVFTGPRLDVPDLLAELAVSVLPSLSEGLSNAVLESMAAGVPVVATQVGGNVEAVEEGVSGLLVPPRDSAALAAAICAVLRDPELARRLGQAGRQRAVEKFSNERMVRETERFYLDVLAKRARRRAGRSRGRV